MILTMIGHPILQFVEEYKIHNLLPVFRDDARLEASGLQYVEIHGRELLIVVFDNRRDVAVMSWPLQLPETVNSMVAIVPKKKEEGYEGIAYRPAQRAESDSDRESPAPGTTETWRRLQVAPGVELQFATTCQSWAG